jgi:hypothetical protein
MKGKLFKAKPSQQKNEVFEFFTQKTKPWERTKTKEYIWKTSIPEKWIDLKGENYFQSSSEVKRPKFSIDLLQNTQKYIHEIKSFHKSTSPKTSKSKKSQKPVSPSSTTSPQAFSSQQKRSVSRDFTRKPASNNPISLLIENRPSTGRCASAGFSEKTEMQDFLTRFEQKQSSQETVPLNKGLLGWKLKRVSKSKRRNSSLDQVNLPQSETIFKSICTHRLPF